MATTLAIPTLMIAQLLGHGQSKRGQVCSVENPVMDDFVTDEVAEKPRENGCGPGLKLNRLTTFSTEQVRLG